MNHEAQLVSIMIHQFSKTSNQKEHGTKCEAGMPGEILVIKHFQLNVAYKKHIIFSAYKNQSINNFNFFSCWAEMSMKLSL